MIHQHTFYLRVFDVGIRVECLDDISVGIISKGFDSLIVKELLNEPALKYILGRSDGNPSFMVNLDGVSCKHYETDYEFLYFFEKSITIELQKIRSDLFVIHSAALEYKNKACLLVAESGGGKSTTTWALLQNDFNYLSDELAAIDLNTMQVHPYAHALCLKKEPPSPFGFPHGTLYTSHTKHIPTGSMPSKIIDYSVDLVSVFFVNYDSEANSPSVSSVSSAEGSARIYANTLNLLAHERYGLGAAIKIGSHCQCFDMVTADLQASCEQIKFEMDKLV